MTPGNLQYKYVAGMGDTRHEESLNLAAEEGYRATLMVCDTTSGTSRGILVLMEKRDES